MTDIKPRSQQAIMQNLIVVARQIDTLQSMQETTVEAKGLISRLISEAIDLEMELMDTYRQEATQKAKLSLSEMTVVKEENDYALMVYRLAKPGKAIIEQWNSQIDGEMQAHLTHMALGICGEAGELADAIKKCTIYGKVIDIQNVIEELGDLEFYMEGIRGCLNITRKEVLAANTSKLAKRYASMGYSDAQAQARADKSVGINSHEEGSVNPETPRHMNSVLMECVPNPEDNYKQQALDLQTK